LKFSEVKKQENNFLQSITNHVFISIKLSYTSHIYRTIAEDEGIQSNQPNLSSK